MEKARDIQMLLPAIWDDRASATRLPDARSTSGTWVGHLGAISPLVERRRGNSEGRGIPTVHCDSQLRKLIRTIIIGCPLDHSGILRVSLPIAVGK